jgi:hypothetical protein
MNFLIKSVIIAGLVSLIAFLSACAPTTGSDEWCEALKQKPKSDWTANEAGDYTKYCVLGVAEPGSDEWCEKMKGKSDDDMTVEEAKIYAKHCLIK